MIHDLQKSSLMKRFSAFLLDLVVFLMVFTGIMLLASSVFDYSAYWERYETRPVEIEEEYKVKYEVKALEDYYYISYEEYLTMDERELNNLPTDVRTTFDACYKATQEAIFTDSEMIGLFEILVNLSLAILSISLLISFLLLEFLVPMLFKNGQTIGKKIFSIAVMRSDGVKISSKILFIRTVLGKFTVETMLPIFMFLLLIIGFEPIVCIAVILLIPLIQLVLMITSRTRSLIHDNLSSTVVVDFQSQMIFESVEAKQEYQLRLHKEAADKASY